MANRSHFLIGGLVRVIVRVDSKSDRKSSSQIRVDSKSQTCKNACKFAGFGSKDG